MTPPEAAGPVSDRMPRQRLAWRGVVLAVSGASVYLLWPALSGVLESFHQLRDLDPSWMMGSLGAQAVAFVSVWTVWRLVLGHIAWGTVIRTQLSSNAVSLVVPAGAAAGAAVQLNLLGRAGIDRDRARSSLAASSFLLTGSVFLLPLVALPLALLSETADPSRFSGALWAGAAMSVLMALAMIGVLRSDRPLRAVGRFTEALQHRLHPHEERVDGALTVRLLAERDRVRVAVAEHKVTAALATAGKPTGEYLTLLCVLAAVGANADPSLVLLSFAASEVAGMIPLTPGGIGFVEAGLSGMLVLGGVDRGDAFLATAAYRLVSFWLPLLIGLVVYTSSGLAARRRRT